MSSSLATNPLLSEPPQCSVWFEPKQWSARYAETFYTTEIVGVKAASANVVFNIEVKTGSINRWIVERNQSQLEQFSKQLTSELPAAGLSSLTLAELPPKKFSLLSEDVSPEYLNTRKEALNTWLHSVLGSAKKISLLPSVRAFLELDRQLEKEPEEPEEPETDATGSTDPDGSGDIAMQQ